MNVVIGFLIAAVVGLTGIGGGSFIFPIASIEFRFRGYNLAISGSVISLNRPGVKWIRCVNRPVMHSPRTSGGAACVLEVIG